VRQIAFGLLLVGAGLGPLAPTAESALVVRLIVQAFFLLACALWVMAMGLEGRLRVRSSGLYVYLGLAALAAAIGVASASNRQAAVLTAYSWLSGMAAFVFVYNEVREPRRRRLLLVVIGASAFVVSLHALHQVFVELPNARADFRDNPEAVLKMLGLPPEMEFDFEGRLGTNSVFGTFLLPNSLAGFLLLVLPAFIGMAMDQLAERGFGESHWPALRRGLFALPMACALYFTKSKGGWLAFAAAMGVFALWAFSREIRRRRMQVLCVILCLLVVGAVSQATGLLTPLRDYVSSSASRLGYWRAGVIIAEDHPVFGAGLDNFADQYAVVKRASDEEARRAHCDYIQIAAETGLIGLVFYLLFWAQFWRRVRALSGPPPLRIGDAQQPAPDWAAGILLLSIVIFGIDMACGSAFHTREGVRGWLWPIGLWLGWTAFVLALGPRRNVHGERPFYTWVGLGAGLVGFFAHSLVDFDHYVGGVVQTAWVFAALVLTGAATRDRIEERVSRRLWPAARWLTTLGAVGAIVLLLYAFVAPLAEAHVRFQTAVDRTNDLTYEERLDELLIAAERNPLDAQSYAFASDMLFGMRLQGKRTTTRGASVLGEAIVLAKRAAAANPVRSEYFQRLGRLYELQWLLGGVRSDLLSARDAYAQAEKLFPGKPDGPLNVGRVYDRDARYDVASGKYFSARALSEEQAMRTRRFSKRELQELSRRIEELNHALTQHRPPPPLNFTEKRLLGDLPPINAFRASP